MRLLKIGADVATRLGQHWMGPEHTLLGIVRGDPEDRARRALEQAGVDAAMVEGWIIGMAAQQSDLTVGEVRARITSRRGIEVLPAPT